MELLIAVGVFGLISGVVYYVVASRAPVSDEVIQRRLENINTKADTSRQIHLHDAEETSIWESVANFFIGDQELPERFIPASEAVWGGRIDAGTPVDRNLVASVVARWRGEHRQIPGNWTTASMGHSRSWRWFAHSPCPAQSIPGFCRIPLDRTPFGPRP